MSDIHGTGYGSKHNWLRGNTSPFKSTQYICRDCGAVFFHNYDDVPNIFKALESQGVPEQCEANP